MLAIGALCSAHATAQPARTAAPKSLKVVHIHIKGDLDSMKIVREFSAELARADDAGLGLLVLELDGNKWRADVVWGIVQAVRGVGAPTATWLSDPRDNRVGTGQAMCAVLAAGKGGDCWIAPRTIISLEPGDDLRSQAPDGTDWERIDREMNGAAWLAMKDRSCDTELGPALLTPGTGGTTWAVPPEGAGGDAGRMRLTTQRPIGEVAAKAVKVISVVPGASGTEAATGAHVEISTELAERLGLARGMARAAGEIISHGGAASMSKTVREIESGLGAARKQVERDSLRIDRAIEQADQTLRDLPRSSEPDYYIRKRRAGQDAVALLEDAQAAIEQTEHTIVEYPELLKSTAPGKTPVGEDPKFTRSTWRASFQQRRDEAAKLLAKAREYAGV